MALSKNAILVIIVAVVVVAAGASAAIVLSKKDSNDSKSNSLLPGVELKILGNADGDDDLDSKDVTEIKKIIEAKGTVEDYPSADANNDKVIDDKDVAFVKAIIDYKDGDPQVPVWHVNFLDADEDGALDMEMVQTMYPVKSAIACGSANILMMLQLMDIVDEIKGISYSSTSADKKLFDTTFLDSSKCVKLGTNTGEIPFEDGKAGSSNVIQDENVTAIIGDWNKTYITNGAQYEAAGVDVIRISAAAVTPELYSHTIDLLGFLFQKEDRADNLLDMYEECYELLAKYKASGSKSAVASSMSNPEQYAYISSGDSDYTEVLTAAGLKFGAEGYDFGGKASIDTWKNLDLYNTDMYDWDYVIHIRAKLNYSGGESDTALKGYCEAFSKYWENTNGVGQYLVSGVIPVPLRILYVESIFNDDLDASEVDELHKEFIKKFYIHNDLDISGLKFFVSGASLYA